MKKALAILILMSIGLGGCFWGPDRYHEGRGYGEHGEHFEHGH